MRPTLYNQGDVVFVTNVKLHDKGDKTVIDLRIKGHPFIILEDVYSLDQTVPCLLVSSSYKGKTKKRHYETSLKLRGQNPKHSYVDIQNIYNIIFDARYAVRGTVTEPVMEEILERVKENI